MDIDKESIEVLSSVMRNAPPISDEDLAGAGQTKKHSKLKKKDSTFLYGNEMAEILKSNQSPEQKLKAACDKYSETLHANRKLMMANKMAEGKIVKLQQENEQCQQQRSKAVLTRSRLENLCRELQKLNKAQKEEIDLKLRLEEEKRKEISATFQNAFAEMTTLTNQNTEKNTKMREENLEMREKIKFVRERVELSEQQLEKVREQAQLEIQLAEAKIATIKMEMTAEKESLLKEKQLLLLRLTEYQVRISELQATEVGLKSQISIYTEKYDDFQNALTKSNELFSGFDEEMEKMSKKILKLEKETSLWKQRWEKSHAALLEMAADKQTRDTEMEKLTHKLSLLQELCKAFQRERAELLAQLRASNNSTTSSCADDDKKTNDVDNKKVKLMPTNCEKFDSDLVQLQNSLGETIMKNNVEKSITIPAIDQENNLIQNTKSDSDVTMNTESIVESCCDNEIATNEITSESDGKAPNSLETNNVKQNSDESKILTDDIKQIKGQSITRVNEDYKLNDANINDSNELSPNSCEISANETAVQSDTDKSDDNNKFCKHESVADKVDKLVIAMKEIELKTEKCLPDIREENKNTENNVIVTIMPIAGNVENRNNNETFVATEDKKEGIMKQNNSNSTKKSGGKKKKK